MTRKRGLPPVKISRGLILAVAHFVSADRFPQAAALVGVQGAQVDGAKELEEGFVGILDTVEPAGGRGEQHDLGLGLQDGAELPPEVPVDLVVQRLEVLDHEHQLSAQPVGGAEHGGAGQLLDPLFEPAAGQRCMGAPQLPRQLRVAGAAFLGKMEQGFEPEVRDVGDLVAFLHEPDRQQLVGQRAIDAQLRGHAREQHGLSPAPGRHDQHMLARWRTDVLAEGFQDDSELVPADHELLYYLPVRLKRPRIRLADRASGSPAHVHGSPAS